MRAREYPARSTLTWGARRYQSFDYRGGIRLFRNHPSFLKTLSMFTLRQNDPSPEGERGKNDTHVDSFCEFHISNRTLWSDVDSCGGLRLRLYRQILTFGICATKTLTTSGMADGRGKSHTEKIWLRR